MNENKLQSAEEYLNENFFNVVLDLKKGDAFLSDIHLAMVDFAKMCVKVALKEVSKFEEVNGEGIPYNCPFIESTMEKLRQLAVISKR